MSTRLCLSNDVTVYHRYAVELGDNGETYGARVTLWIAPEIMGSADEYIYITSGGDPSIVGWLDRSGDGGVEIYDDAREWLDKEPWITEIIDRVLDDTAESEPERIVP